MSLIDIGESFFYNFCLVNICLSLSDNANKIKTLDIERAQQFKFSHNVSPIHGMVSEKFFSKNSKFYRGCTAHLTFLPPSNFAVLMSDISFNTAYKDLKIAQIAQLNQLFLLLHLAHIYGHCFY